jgi:hypothetical protein
MRLSSVGLIVRYPLQLKPKRYENTDATNQRAARKRSMGSPVVNEVIVNWIDDNMSELLLTEREIIEDAFFEGGLSNEPYEPLTGADYYNINFKE